MQSKKRFIPMDSKEIHEFVDSRPNVFWQEWTAIIVDYRNDGWLRKDGIFFKDRWGTQSRIKPDSKGLWWVPAKYV